MSTSHPPLEPGQPAPSFTLPAANRDGTVSLEDYRGRNPVLLALFRGLYCPFCRHQIARLSIAADKLRGSGIETLGVVATPAERARLYFRFRQARIPLGADPQLATHRAYGLPNVPVTPEILQAVDGVAVEWARDLGIAAQPGRAYDAVNQWDGYQPSDADHADFDRHQAQFIGQFLIDRHGVVRWANIERAPGEFPSEGEFVEAVRHVSAGA